MSEGYGLNWDVWDSLVKEKFKDQLEKLGQHKYRNCEVFKSPKGRWMVFYGTDYSDIKVYDLETLDLVATNFYSNAIYENGKYNKDKSTYASHTNVSTFVPSYIKHSFISSVYNKENFFLIKTAGADKTEFDWDKVISVPIAFNAWTIWGADWELYVDVLDLRLIDEGIIKRWDKKTIFTIPIEANHVRNYVKFEADSWTDVNTGIDSSDIGEYTIDFSILQERQRDRYNVNIVTNDITFYDMYDQENSYKTEDQLPWEDAKKRMDEYKEKKDK